MCRTIANRRQVLKAGLAPNAALSVAALVDHAHHASAAATPIANQSQTRDIVVTMVPLLGHEMSDFLPYLTDDFAKGGMLDGKEVYAFMPSTLVAYGGDTLNLHLSNPTDDPHTFTVLELSQSVFVAPKTQRTLTLTSIPVGIYPVMCVETEHMPFMWGQLVLLQPS